MQRILNENRVGPGYFLVNRSLAAHAVQPPGMIF
jgi:hypothetical protein